MLHTRIIPVLTFKDGRMIKTVKFDEYRDVGHPITTARFYDSQDVDELVLLDMTATQEQRQAHLDIIKTFADECSMPLTIGGGVQTLDDIQALLNLGADKVCINSHAVKHPDFITIAAHTFGQQCIVISIDAKQTSSGHEVYIDGGYTATNLSATAWAKQIAELGAGEILINSIDRDGTALGYDIDLIQSITQQVNIPVIALGGVGTLQDLMDGLVYGKASAVACSTLFHFTDNKPVKANAYVQEVGKQFAHEHGIELTVRAV